MESARSTRTIAGAGREIIAADQPARMPPQASMARSDTMPQAGTTAGDRSSAQTSPASVAAVVSGDAVQLAVESPPVSAQQHVAVHLQRALMPQVPALQLWHHRARLLQEHRHA